MHEVDLRFICTAHQVEERSLRAFVDLLCKLDGSPCSIERLAELTFFSPQHAKRILRAMAWHDERNPPMMRAEASPGRGKQGRRYINRERVAMLGLIDHAA